MLDEEVVELVDKEGDVIRMAHGDLAGREDGDVSDALETHIVDQESLVVRLADLVAAQLVRLHELDGRHQTRHQGDEDVDLVQHLRFLTELFQEEQFVVNVLDAHVVAEVQLFDVSAEVLPD